MKFDPVSVNFVLSKGCGTVVGNVLCETLIESLVLVGRESEVKEGSSVLSDVNRAVDVVVIVSVLGFGSGEGVGTRVSLVEELLSPS